MLRIFGGDPENKVHLLLDYTDHPHEIADPWYTRDFRKAEAEINEAAPPCCARSGHEIINKWVSGVFCR